VLDIGTIGCTRVSRLRMRSGGSDFSRRGRHDSRLQLPVSLFEDLLSAFVRYHTHATNLGRRARITAEIATPWGARAANRRDAMVAWTNRPTALCTALQLTNFWQDIGATGSGIGLYVPSDDVDACQARVRDLSSGP